MATRDELLALAAKLLEEADKIEEHPEGRYDLYFPGQALRKATLPDVNIFRRLLGIR